MDYNALLTSQAVIDMTDSQFRAYIKMLCYMAGEGKTGLKKENTRLMDMLKCTETDLNIILQRTFEVKGYIFNKKLLGSLPKDKNEKPKPKLFDMPADLTPDQQITFKKEKVDQELMAYENEYTIDMLNQFHRYWTEPTPDKTKIKMELEIEKKGTWDYKRRLETWKSMYRPTPSNQVGKTQQLLDTNQEVKDLLNNIE